MLEAMFKLHFPDILKAKLCKHPFSDLINKLVVRFCIKTMHKKVNFSGGFIYSVKISGKVGEK